MPVSEPRDDESSDDFHGRCMTAIWGEFKDKDNGMAQANAICFDRWRDRGKSIDTGTDLVAYDLQGQRRREASAAGGPMRIYGEITKVEEQDDGTIKVHGIASSPAVDEQGETVLPSAMRDAIPDYLKFPALREMHNLQAAGTTLHAQVGDDGVTRIVGHVVDPVAVKKVKNNVYRGFSIGGKVLERAAGDYKTISRLALQEISLVDRPANPEAVLDMWKASTTEKDMAGGLVNIGDTPAGDALRAAMAVAMSKVGDQIWPCGDQTHNHTKKDDAARCIFGKSVAELREAAVAKLEVDPPAPPKPSRDEKPEGNVDGDDDEDDTAEGNLGGPGVGNVPVGEAHPDRGEDPGNEPGAPVGKADKPEGDYGDVTYADPGFRNGKKRYPLDTEERIRAAWSYINMPKNAKKYSGEQLSSIKAKIRAAMKRIGVEMTSKVADDADERQMINWLVELIAAADVGLADLVVEKAGRRQSAADNFLVNVAHDAVAKLTDGQFCAKAENATQDTGSGPRLAPAQPPVPGDTYRPGANATQDTSKRGARHSKGMMDNLRSAHDALRKAGASCAGTADGMNKAVEATEVNTNEGQAAKVAEPTTEDAVAKAVRKVLKRARREHAAELEKALAANQGKIDKMEALLEQIAKQPVPATAAGVLPAGVVSVSKSEDGGGSAPGPQPPVPTAEEVAKVLAGMGEFERFRYALDASKRTPYVQTGR